MATERKTNSSLSNPLSIPSPTAPVNASTTTNVVKWGVYNKDGEKIDDIYTLPSGAKPGTTVYKTKSGSYSTTPEISFAYNKDTGKIDVEAPEAVFKSDWYKESFKDDNTMARIIELYKQDPSGKTGVQFQDKDGNVVEKTVKDWMDERAEAFKEYASQYVRDLVPVIDDVRQSTKSGITLSDRQAIIALHKTNRDKYRYDDTTVVYLPSAILRLGDFENYGSYNAEAGTMSAKDFYDWYDLNDDKGKDIMEIRKVLNWQLDHYMNTAEHGEGDAEELAKTLSFYKTLNEDEPEGDFFQHLGLGMYSFEKGFKQTIIDADINLYSFIEDVGVWAANATSVYSDSGKVLAVATLGGSILANAAISFATANFEKAKIDATNFGQLVAGIDSSPEEVAGVEGFIALADITAGLVRGEGRKTIEHWAAQTGTPTNQEVLDSFDNIVNINLDSLSALSGAVKIGRGIGSFVGEIVKQVVLTNTVGAGAGAVASGLATRGGMMLNMLHYANDIRGAAQALQSGINSYASMASLLENTSTLVSSVEKIAAAAGFGANLLAQGVTDTILNDEDTLHALLTNPDDRAAADAFAAVQKNTAMNLFGEVTGLGFSLGGRAKKGVAEWLVDNTRAGATVDAATKRVVNYFAGKKHVALAQFAEWMSEGKSAPARLFDKIFKASDSASKWYADLHWREAEAAFNVAYAAKGITDIDAANEATARAVFDKMQLEVSLNRVTRGIMREWQSIIRNPAIIKEYGDFNDAYSALVKAEGASAVDVGKGVYLSQDTSDYIALRTIVDRLNNKEAAAGLSKLEEAYRSGLRDRITKYEMSHSVEVKGAAEDVINKFRQYEKAYMGWAATGVDDGGIGLYTEDTLKGWVETGYWGKDGGEYIPLVAVKTGEDPVAATKRIASEWESAGNYQAKLSVDDYSVKPGDVDAHYLDPSLSMYAQQVTAAKVITARDWGNALKATDSLAREINVDGEAVVKSDISKARSQIRNTAKDTFNLFRTSDQIYDYSFSVDYSRGAEGAVEKYYRRAQRVLGLSKPEAYSRAAYGLELQDFDALRALGVDIPNIGRVSTRAELDAIMGMLSDADKAIVQKALGSETLTVRHFNKAISSTDLGVKLQRSLAGSSDAITSNPKYQQYIASLKENALSAKSQLRLASIYDRYADAVEQTLGRAEGVDDFTNDISQFTEDLISRSSDSLAGNKFLNKMLKRYAEEGVPEDVARRYLILEEYKKYFDGAHAQKALNEMLDKNLAKIGVSGNLTTKAKIGYKKVIKEALKENIDSEWAASANMLRAAGGNELIDTESVYNYIYKQMSDFVDTTVKSPNVVQMLDGNGVFRLYELSPTTANLYTTRPDFSSYKNKGLSGFFNKTNRLARLGSVGYSLRSFANQWVRDPLNAYVMGGMMRTLGNNAEATAELLGPQVVEYMQQAMGKAGWSEFSQQLSETLGREATQTEIETAAKEAFNSSMVKEQASLALGDLGPETEYYRQAAKGYKDAVWGEFEEKAGAMSRGLDWVESHSIGNAREMYLRKGVYAQSFNDAIAAGRTVQEAKTIAEFTMLNATTNFSRSFAWGNNIVNSVPFLGAAINGKASFWRLLEVDPIGVSSRFLNGLVLPGMALISQSLQTEQDKEVYATIPEWEKEDNIVFVLNGEKMKIPIPQELSAFLSPFRHAVEDANGARKHAWSELVWNDILGTSAIDLTGLVNLDANTLQGDQTIADRLSAEARALISQLSPVVVKSVYMAITGIDPYTGNAIDRRKTYIDEDGNEVIYDSGSSMFTSWLSDRLSEMGIDVSGSTMHALLKTWLGSGGSNLLDMISDMFSGEWGEAAATPFDDLSRAFRSSSSDDAASFAWNEAIKDLKKQKDALMADKSFTNISSALQQLNPSASDYESKRKNLLAQYNEKIQEYQQNVYNTVKNLQAQYGNSYGRKEFAATINLLTFYKTFGNNLTEAERQTNQKLYFNARSRALMTMADYGFDSPSDLSIFGYIRTNEYGDVEAKAFDPVAIMNQSSEVWGVADIDVANIESLLEQNNLTRKEMFGDAYKKAKASGKKAYKAYKAEWNKKVVKTLYSYVQSHGVDAVLNSFKTRDVLNNYLFVSPYNETEYMYEIFGGKK